jgi:hypothetical protein
MFALRAQRLAGSPPSRVRTAAPDTALCGAGAALSIATLCSHVHCSHHAAHTTKFARCAETNVEQKHHQHMLGWRGSVLVAMFQTCLMVVVIDSVWRMFVESALVSSFKIVKVLFGLLIALTLLRSQKVAVLSCSSLTI